MPGGDRTGPMGQGPMTGRGAGFCAGNRMGGYGGFAGGRGFGRGAGRGFGLGRQNQNRSFAGVQRLDSREMIEERVAFLEEEIKNAREQLNNISDSEA